MSLYNSLIENLPEVQKPTQKRLSFNEKLKWTLAILVLFYVLGLVPIFGLGQNALQQFRFLALILGAEFGSIISLGIGPIVTASIVLQLLNGSGIIKFDLTSTEGKKSFQGTQKLLALVFIIFESFVYVYTNAFAPAPGINPNILVFQLIMGGVLILFMDEVVSKWGFGSGISLFIAAGVSKQVMIRLISPLTGTGSFFLDTGDAPVGSILSIFYFLQLGTLPDVMVNVFAIVATVSVFAIAVYAQSMKVEVPLSFGRIRGHGIRWPLSFLYTSNIPVILVAALIANIQLWARLLESKGYPILGSYGGQTGISSGFVAWLTPPNIISGIITGSLRLNPWWNSDVAHALVYMLFLICGAVVFSIFWVQTAGMDAKSQAKQMMSSGLQIPGFRRDERVLESLLSRYITPLTVMGAIAVGFLASLADISGALTSGTGLLLTVMIIYRLYEEIAQQHAFDMYPMMRKFMEK